jgi:hypothetical protein
VAPAQKEALDSPDPPRTTSRPPVEPKTSRSSFRTSSSPLVHRVWSVGLRGHRRRSRRDPDHTCGLKRGGYSKGMVVVMHMGRGRYGPPPATLSCDARRMSEPAQLSGHEEQEGRRAISQSVIREPGIVRRPLNPDDPVENEERVFHEDRGRRNERRPQGFTGIIRFHLIGTGSCRYANLLLPGRERLTPGATRFVAHTIIRLGGLDQKG